MSSVRIRETRGVSYPDPHRPGVRRWRSTSVSFGLGTWLFGLGAWAVIVFPFVALFWLLAAELWLCAEALLIIVTGVLVLALVVMREAKPADVTVMRLRFGLFMISLRGRS
jgi:hypothetical protein